MQKKLFVELDSDEKIIYNYLKKEGKSVLDTIAIACEMPTVQSGLFIIKSGIKRGFTTTARKTI